MANGNGKAAKGKVSDNSANDAKVDVVTGEICPVCSRKSLALAEREQEIPYFGKVFLFSMTCNSCKFHKADVECAEEREPARYSIEVSGPDDMSIRVVKSGQGTVRIPYVADIEPGEASNGYVTNIEGLLQRVKHQVEAIRDTDEDEDAVQKAKNLIKKINRCVWGEEKLKIIIEDPTGNSAIISDKAVVQKLAGKASAAAEE
ncbi:ZPR1 zinc finger domain-containing protein [Candidatus Woesearchaeota archaeon]|nr:ZPR1 zinc finger domain-containing protein [Candidatus Woesearchaeota archaeon]